MKETGCSVFYCDVRKGRFCCAFCPDPCAHRCLNSPDRCKLAEDTAPRIKNTAHRLTEKEGEEINRMILTGKFSVKQIAAYFGVANNTVYSRKQKLFEQMEAEYGRKK